jgi:CRP/FNR family transcriptional regulator, cyclic AMP receptor protein
MEPIAMREAPDNPFFRGLSPEQLELILPLFEAFTIPAGTMIFKQGDVATYLYVVQRGSVTIQYKPYDGPMITLSHLQAGEVFGWSSVVGARTYTSDAISTAEVDMLRLRGSDLIQLCREQPVVGYAILDRLAEVVSPRWTYAREQIQNILESHAPQPAQRAAH